MAAKEMQGGVWVLDDQNNTVAVVPVGERGSGDARIRVAYAPPNTPLHDELLKARAKGRHLEFDGDHPLAKQAFARQTSAPEKPRGRSTSGRRV